MLNLTKTRSRRLTPKEKPDRKKPQKPIARRSKFKDYTPPKVHRKMTDSEVMVRAKIEQQKRLKNPSEAELAFHEFLLGHKIKHERERIFINGDRHLLIDFFLPDKNLAIEIDGVSHQTQKGYDEGRDKWLAERGIKTVRISNAKAKTAGAHELMLIGEI